jgi:hypothetical protein
MMKKIYVYRLTDAKGDKTITVVNEPNDNGTIGGYGSDGKYHQYDSYELWYAYEWATLRGMKLESTEMIIDVPDSLFLTPR